MPEDLEPDPERRYRMAFTGDSMLLAFSPDGINWTLSEDNPLWRTYSFTRSEYGGSLDNVVYFLDPEEPIAERRFKAYPQTYVARKDNDRVTGLMVSPDGFHFKPYVNNPVIDADLGVEMQHHMMEVCWRRHGVLIGLYGCYLDSVNVDARLAVSRDGVHWVTVKNEVPFLERGEPGAWDAGMVFPSNTPIIEGEDIWIYYSGVEFNFAAGEGHASTGRARVRFGRFRQDAAGVGGAARNPDHDSLRGRRAQGHPTGSQRGWSLPCILAASRGLGRDYLGTHWWLHGGGLPASGSGWNRYSCELEG